MARDLAKDTKNAFDFIERLYRETVYLIKEVEGLLKHDEVSPFAIITSSGYAITTAASKSLTMYRPWLPHDATVFFRPITSSTPVQSKAKTPISLGLNMLVLRVEFVSAAADRPQVLMACLHHVKMKRGAQYFEDLNSTFAYGGGIIFARRAEGVVDYEDAACIIKGRLIQADLFAIENSDAIVTRLVQPILEIYRSRRSQSPA